MAKIQVRKVDDNTFEVTVQSGLTTTHTVKLSEEYYQKLTGGKASKETLIQKSFKFLLEHEDNTSILSHFDLPLIGHYFSEYESRIGERL